MPSHLDRLLGEQEPAPGAAASAGGAPSDPLSVEGMTAAMRKAGLNESQIADVLEAQGLKPRAHLPGEGPPGPEALRGLGTMAQAGILAGTTALGGSVGRALLGRFVGRPAAAAVGEFAGGAGGGLLTGQSPRQALKTGMMAGGFGGATEAGLNLGARFLGAGVRMPEKAVEETLGRGPIEGARSTRFGSTMLGFGSPPTTAEAKLAGGVLNRAVMEKEGTYPDPAAYRAFTDRIRNVARRAQGLPPLDTGPPLSTAMSTAESEMARIPGPIDTVEIRDKIQSLMRKPVVPNVRGSGGRFLGAKLATPAEEQANAALKDALTRLPPQFGSLEEMQDYLRRIRQPISGTFGKDIPRLTTQDAKAIQASIREYRDRLLGGPGSTGAMAFARAAQREQIISQARKMLEKPGGGLKEGAPAKMAYALRPQKAVTLETIRSLDPGLAADMERLSLQRAWTRPKQPVRAGMAKLMAIGTRPVGQAASVYGAFSTRPQPKEAP